MGQRERESEREEIDELCRIDSTSYLAKQYAWHDDRIHMGLV